MRYLLLFLCLSSCAFGQTKKPTHIASEFNRLSSAPPANEEPAPPKIKVYFDCTCDDTAGARYATALRDLIASSPRYVASTTFEDPATLPGENYPRFHWVVSAASINVADSSGAIRTAISVVIRAGRDIFMSQSVFLCGENAVAGCAADTLASLDSKAANWKYK
jgi:hypothetical protein